MCEHAGFHVATHGVWEVGTRRRLDQGACHMIQEVHKYRGLNKCSTKTYDSVHCCNSALQQRLLLIWMSFPALIAHYSDMPVSYTHNYLQFLSILGSAHLCMFVLSPGKSTRFLVSKHCSKWSMTYCSLLVQIWSCLYSSQVLHGMKTPYYTVHTPNLLLHW